MSFSIRESSAAGQSTNPPILTIGIPTWNRVDRLCHQLDALLPHVAACHDTVEILVCDNGSTDGTWERLLGYLDTAPCRIRCIRNGTNIGASPNCLRVFEAAQGEWTWLIGDDDNLDFSQVPVLLQHLGPTQTPVLILLDRPDARPAARRHVDIDQFFERANDMLAVEILQYSRVICQTSPLKQLLRKTYTQAMAHMHPHGFIYGSLILQPGADVLHLPLITHEDPESPRWDMIKGYLGAWMTALETYAGHRKEARAREIRLRQKRILSMAQKNLIAGTPLQAADLDQIRRLFTLGGRLELFLTRAAFRINKALAIRLLRLMRPKLFRGAHPKSSPQAKDY